MFCPSFDGQEELAVCTDICHDLRTFEFAESNFSKLLHYSVKGRLKASIEFWRFIGAPKFILHIISDGYKIPFITTPPPVHLKNNGSALEHSDFVNDAILELLQDNRIEELTTPPETVNPLTISVQSSGKKKLAWETSSSMLYRDLKETFTSLFPPPPPATCRRNCGVGVSK